MALRYWYVCKVNPVPWRVGPAGIARNNGKMRAYVGRDQELYTYQQAIKEELAKQNPVMMDGELSLTLFFWRNLASFEGVAGKKASSNVADTTNMFKATEDACQKILFVNDRANVVTRGYTVAQGPEVEGCVVICLEKVLPGDVDDIIKLLPESVYQEVYGNGDQLLLALDGSMTSPSDDGSQWAASGDDF